MKEEIIHGYKILNIYCIKLDCGTFGLVQGWVKEITLKAL